MLETAWGVLMLPVRGARSEGFGSSRSSSVAVGGVSEDWRIWIVIVAHRRLDLSSRRPCLGGRSVRRGLPIGLRRPKASLLPCWVGRDSLMVSYPFGSALVEIIESFVAWLGALVELKFSAVQSQLPELDA